MNLFSEIAAAFHLWRQRARAQARARELQMEAQLRQEYCERAKRFEAMYRERGQNRAAEQPQPPKKVQNVAGLRLVLPPG